ncbi:unnamed protein product [Schistosoma mattheei]|uniref:SANT domain-containing protein n=1 Tax=Schistosoma mattheei TaxID=31246 RepID=A0AA85B1M2_9TREM|nr:unnamed protein product [Schistosoma mattheei]
MNNDDWWHPISNHASSNNDTNVQCPIDMHIFDQKWLSIEHVQSSNNDNNNLNVLANFQLKNTTSTAAFFDEKHMIHTTNINNDSNIMPPNIHLTSLLKLNNNEPPHVSSSVILNSSSLSSSPPLSSSSWSTQQRKQAHKSNFHRPIPQPLQLINEPNYQTQLGISSQYSPITPAPMNMSMHTLTTECGGPTTTTISSSSVNITTITNCINVDSNLFIAEHQHRPINNNVECDNSHKSSSSICCFDANRLGLGNFPDSLLFPSMYNNNSGNLIVTDNTNTNNNFVGKMFSHIDSFNVNNNSIKPSDISMIPSMNHTLLNHDRLLNITTQKRNLSKHQHYQQQQQMNSQQQQHHHHQYQQLHDQLNNSNCHDKLYESKGNCTVCYSQHHIYHQVQQQQQQKQHSEPKQLIDHIEQHQNPLNICLLPSTTTSSSSVQSLQLNIPPSSSSYYPNRHQYHEQRNGNDHFNNNNNTNCRPNTEPSSHTCSQYSYYQPVVNSLGSMDFTRQSTHEFINTSTVHNNDSIFIPSSCISSLNPNCCSVMNMTLSSCCNSSAKTVATTTSPLSIAASSNFIHAISATNITHGCSSNQYSLSVNGNNCFNLNRNRLQYKQPLLGPPLSSTLHLGQEHLYSIPPPPHHHHHYHHHQQQPTKYPIMSSTSSSSNHGIYSCLDKIDNCRFFNGSELLLHNQLNHMNGSIRSHHNNISNNNTKNNVNNNDHNYKHLFRCNEQPDSFTKHTSRSHCCLTCLELERKRHISAPAVNSISSQSSWPSLSLSSSSSSLSVPLSLSSHNSSISPLTCPGNPQSHLQPSALASHKNEFVNKSYSCLPEYHNHHYRVHHHYHHRGHYCKGTSSSEGVVGDQPSSDVVAELLMQSHITDPDGLSSLTCDIHNSCPTTPELSLTPIPSPALTQPPPLPSQHQKPLLVARSTAETVDQSFSILEDECLYRPINIMNNMSSIFPTNKMTCIPSSSSSFLVPSLSPATSPVLPDLSIEQHQQQHFSKVATHHHHHHHEQQHQKLPISLHLPITSSYSVSNLNQSELLDLTVPPSITQNNIVNCDDHDEMIKKTTNQTTSNNNKYPCDSGNDSVAAKLSKSLAEDNLFRNPTALPPPKKMKSKPAPISIPPQTGANLSRLRSPRVWSSKRSSLNSSPPPYTPPPMLSPIRQGSGLFSSLSRWVPTPTTVSGGGASVTTSTGTRSVGSGTLMNRRFSSYYSSISHHNDSEITTIPNTSTMCATGSGVNSGGQLKRRHASSSGTRNSGNNIFTDPTNTTTNNNSYDNNNVNTGSITDLYMRDVNRPIAYTRRRRQQLTPKSAPVLILNCNTTKNSANQSRDLQDNELSLQSQQQFSNTDTVFGYDDETMRRFAEADEAYRLNRQKHQDKRYSRRRYDTEINASNDQINHHTTTTPTDDDNNNNSNESILNKTDHSFNFADEQLLNFDFEMKIKETNYSETTIQFNSDVELDSEHEMEDEEDDDDEEGVPTSIIPHINVGHAYQAEIPDFCQEITSDETNKESPSNWEMLLWYPAYLDEHDPKNIESLNLLTKIACSPAVRNCGLNMEYTFHLLCKYKGDVEMTLHALLRDTLVVYDYVYAETTAWTTEEIVRFQQGLAMHGRDFHQVSKDLQAAGMNKTVKACVEFYYVWKRMNTPSDVKWYRERARRQRPLARMEPIITEEPLSEQFEAIEQCNTYTTDMNSIQTLDNNIINNNNSVNVPYNLRRKQQQTTISVQPPPSSLSTNLKSDYQLTTKVNTNDIVVNNDNSNSLENSYDDFMDIVFNESFPIY